MPYQFQCPFCESAMEAETGSAEFSVDCPVCGKSFIVDAPPEPVRVKATVVPGPAPHPAPVPAARQPQQRVPHTQSDLQAKARLRREERRAKLAMAALLVGGPLILGGMIWAASAFNDATHKRKTEATVEPPYRADLAESVRHVQEVVGRQQRQEADADARAEEANKAWRDEQKKEELAQAYQRRVFIRGILAREVFNGDQEMAEEAAREFEEAERQVMALYNDLIPFNEPKNPQEMLQKVFLERLLANRKFMTWAKGRSLEEYARRIIQGGFRGPDGKPVAKGSVQEMLLSGKYTSTGSAFWISRDGWLITNAHVTGTAASVDLRTADGKIISARVVKIDKEKDLALLKSDSSGAWLPIYTGKSSLKGLKVTAAGFPRPLIQGLECKTSSGEINSDSGSMDNPDVVQCDVAIFPGNSGGPLIESKTGLVVGVISSQIVSRGPEAESGKVSYAVKSSILGHFVSTVPEAKPLLEPAAAPKNTANESIAARASKAAVMVLVK
jgi:S1-C subfamily serine protease